MRAPVRGFLQVHTNALLGEPVTSRALTRRAAACRQQVGGHTLSASCWDSQLGASVCSVSHPEAGAICCARLVVEGHSEQLQVQPFSPCSSLVQAW